MESGMKIDWKEIHQRLAATRKMIEHESTRTPAEIRKILKTRARTLAREPEDHDMNGESIDVLEFRLASENYAIELPFIQEVYPLKALTAVPGVPSFVLGIINVHGKIYSVMDIKKFFELPEKGLSDLNKVIIVQYNGIEFGVLADVISGVRSVSLKDIQPPLPTLTGIRQEYLKGVTRDQLIVLDTEKLLTDKTLIVSQQGL
jgi:purine-binding chemotaxis protein CheW